MSESNQTARSDAVAGQKEAAQGRRSGIWRWLLLGCGVTALLICIVVAAFVIWMRGLDFNPNSLWTYANPTDEAENHSYYQLIGVVGERLIVQIKPHAGFYHAFMALDRRSGAELWRTPVANDPALDISYVTPELLTDRSLIVSISSSPLWPSHPFFLSEPHFLLAIDLEDGRLLWQQPGVRVTGDGYLDGAAEPLFVTESETGHLVGLDGETGAVRVRAEIPTQRSLVAHGIVYGAGPEGGLFAVDGDGELLWQIQTSELADALSFAEGRLFYRTQDGGRLAALDAATGRELWGRPDVWWFTVAGENLAVAEGEGADLAILAAATGDVHQRLPLFISRWDNNAPHLVVSDGVLYQATGKRFAAYDLRSGGPLWESDLPSEVDWMDNGNGVIAVGDTFYATFYETHLISPGSAFSRSTYYFAVGDMRTGEIRQWGRLKWNQIITDGEFLYVSDFDNGTVRATAP